MFQFCAFVVVIVAVVVVGTVWLRLQVSVMRMCNRK